MITPVIFELLFCKKIPLSRRVEYVMDGSMDQSVSESVSEICMYVTPIRLDLLYTANQISCRKGKWYMYVRRFDPDTVQNGHIYSTTKEEKVFI